MQAVNRKAEGIEPRKLIVGKDDAFRIAEVYMDMAEMAWRCPLPRGR